MAKDRGCPNCGVALTLPTDGECRCPECRVTLYMRGGIAHAAPQLPPPDPESRLLARLRAYVGDERGLTTHTTVSREDCAALLALCEEATGSRAIVAAAREWGERTAALVAVDLMGYPRAVECRVRAERALLRALGDPDLDTGPDKED